MIYLEAAVIVAITILAFGLGYMCGRDKAYDEAFDNAIRTVNEVCEEEP